MIRSSSRSSWTAARRNSWWCDFDPKIPSYYYLHIRSHTYPSTFFLRLPALPEQVLPRQPDLMCCRPPARSSPRQPRSQPRRPTTSLKVIPTLHTYKPVKSSLRPVSVPVSVFIFHLFLVSHPVLPRNGVGWRCLL